MKKPKILCRLVLRAAQYAGKPTYKKAKNRNLYEFDYRLITKRFSRPIPKIQILPLPDPDIGDSALIACKGNVYRFDISCHYCFGLYRDAAVCRGGNDIIAFSDNVDSDVVALEVILLPVAPILEIIILFNMQIYRALRITLPAFTVKSHEGEFPEVVPVDQAVIGGKETYEGAMPDQSCGWQTHRVKRDLEFVLKRNA